MIGSFWNLCRACPSMPVDKLHSEYRSTYRWHQHHPQREGAAGGGVAQQPAPAPPAVLAITRGPMEPAMPRRKKYPGVAYKTNELFKSANGEVRPQPTAADRARSIQRDETDRAGRRSKSEGPRQTRWTDTLEAKTSTALAEGVVAKKPEVVTEYRKQFAWPKEGDSTPRKSISMGALKKAAAVEGCVEAEPLMNHVDEGDHDGVKSHNEDLWNGLKPAIQRKSTIRSALSALISNGEDRSNRKRYKTEYKKKFRPFSSYIFEASKGTFTKCRGKGKVIDEASEKMLGGEEETALPKQSTQLQNLGEAQGDSWYREVLDLRKRAGEYKYRGWGTELAPEHITQIYSKQIELWQQVSRRSSLAALSLAATTHKPITRDERDGKDSRTHSPKKFRSFRSAPHQSIHSKLQETKGNEKSPHKTSPQKQRKKLQGSSFDEGATQDGPKSGEFKSPRRRPRSADPAPVAPRPASRHEPPVRPHKPTGVPLSRGGSVRVRSTPRDGRSSSASRKTPTKVDDSQGVKKADNKETKSARRADTNDQKLIGKTETSDNKRVRRNEKNYKNSQNIDKTNDKKTSCRNYVNENKNVQRKDINDVKKLANTNSSPSRSVKNSTKTLRENDTSAKKTLVNGVGNSPRRERRSRSISKVGIRLDDEISSHRSASVAKEMLDDSPVVKSPPEPTRVKSPEQMNMRSPDPVNWTVPLDTGKTFTVTQNVKNDETVKRPNSDFKGGSVEEGAISKLAESPSIHPQQMSPIRSMKKSESPTTSKRTDKSPTTPTNLTPIDETRVLDVKVNGVNGITSNQLTPETPEIVKKSIEATQVAPGVVDTTVVNPPTGGLSATEVLEIARTKFDKFWGKKDEDVV